MDPTLRQKIQCLEQKGQRLQKQAKYKQSLDIYQEILELKKNTYGTQNQQYQRISIKLCQLCNLIAMILLQKQKFDLCLMFLKKGQTYCFNNSKYTAVTYNNYACYYRKTGKLRTALMYLQSSLEMQWKDKQSQTLADTYLNLCAVLSQLNKHTQALQNVLFSITILQQELLGVQAIKIQRVPVLAIAYHNLGVELEYLKRFDESISSYEKSLKFAEKHLGIKNGLVENLQTVLQKAKEAKNLYNKKQKRNHDQQKQKIIKMKSTYAERPQTSYKYTTKKINKF